MWISAHSLTFKKMKNIFLLLFLLLSIAATAQNVTRMATASGTNTYTATFNPPLTSLNSATLYVITFTNANTSTTVTLNPDGLVAATAIKDNAGNDPPVGALVAGGTYTLRYNGTNFRVTGTAILTLTELPNLTIQSNDYINLQADNDIDIDAGGDVKINGVAGTSGEFIGNVDGHWVWATPPGTGGGGVGGSGVLDVQTTTVGNITTGEDVLYTYTLPADTLDVDEEGLNLRFSGRFAANGNTKTLKIKFGPTTIMTRALTDPTITTSWTVVCEIIRTSSTTQECNCTFSGGDGLATSNIATASATLSSTVDIVVTGEATSTDDIERSTGTVTMLGGIGGGGAGGGDLSLSDFVTSETPTGTVDGVNDDFTLAFTPAGGVHFYINGLLQEVGGGNDYTISGPNITTTTPPAPGSILLASYIK